jgi:cytidylate kinase
MSMVPVIAVDGPSGSGKGTISQLLAARLGWHFLDSGAIYRALGLAARARGIALDAETDLAALAGQLELRFEGERILLDRRDVSDEIRTETSGNAASKVAALPAVRAALLGWQRDQARAPGLVADGRDMGSVIFPHAVLKIFLTASAEERAQRRYKQLKEKGFDVSLSPLVEEIEERDRRDRSRSAAPLRPAADAVELDSTGLSIEEVFDQVLDQVRFVLPQHLD